MKILLFALGMLVSEAGLASGCDGNDHTITEWEVVRETARKYDAFEFRSRAVKFNCAELKLSLANDARVFVPDRNDCDLIRRAIRVNNRRHLTLAEMEVSMQGQNNCGDPEGAPVTFLQHQFRLDAGDACGQTIKFSSPEYPPGKVN